MTWRAYIFPFANPSLTDWLFITASTSRMFLYPAALRIPMLLAQVFVNAFSMFLSGGALTNWLVLPLVRPPVSDFQLRATTPLTTKSTCRMPLSRTRYAHPSAYKKEGKWNRYVVSLCLEQSIVHLKPLEEFTTALGVCYFYKIPPLIEELNVFLKQVI